MGIEYLLQQTGQPFPEYQELEEETVEDGTVDEGELLGTQIAADPTLAEPLIPEHVPASKGKRKSGKKGDEKPSVAGELIYSFNSRIHPSRASDTGV